MRGVIGRRLSNRNGFTFASIVKQSPFLIQPTSYFSSSSSSDGSGRGRGRGRGFTGGDVNGHFGINRNESVNQGRDSSESQSPGGYGNGRGRPIQSNPISPPFSSFVKPDSDYPGIGRGRGSVGSEPVSPFAQSPPNVESQGSELQTQTQPQLPPKTPVVTQLQEMKEEASSPPMDSKSGEVAPPDNIFNALGSEFSHLDPGNGAGRGKSFVKSSPAQNEGENRHIRRPQPPPPQKRAQTPKDETLKPQLSAEEAGRRARSELARGEAVEASGVRGGRGGGRGRGGRGVRGRGGRGGRGGEGWGNDKKEGEAEQEAISIFVGDSADGEKFAKKMGPELMKELADGFEEICDKALPSTTHDAIVDAYDTNLMVKFLFSL